MPRTLFGPASATFSKHDLGSSADAILFDFEGKHSLTPAPDASWQTIVAQLPDGWEPELLVLNLAYKTIPVELFNVPVPIIGLAPDWNLLWSSYRHVLPRCDVVFTDEPGVERFQRIGFDHVRAANLFGLEAAFIANMPPASERDIDVLFVGRVPQPFDANERAFRHTDHVRPGV
jgi:hypothetical protein